MYRKYGKGQYQIDKGNEASARIAGAVVALSQEGRLPSGAAERALAISQYGRLSQATLYKKYNLHLWHPRYASVELGMPE